MSPEMVEMLAMINNIEQFGHAPMEQHKDSGFRCLLAHGEGGQCISCLYCRRYIRPNDLNKPCPGYKGEKQ